jgi:hypothetical protein
MNRSEAESPDLIMTSYGAPWNPSVVDTLTNRRAKREDETHSQFRLVRPTSWKMACIFLALLTRVKARFFAPKLNTNCPTLRRGFGLRIAGREEGSLSSDRAWDADSRMPN